MQVYASRPNQHLKLQSIETVVPDTKPTNVLQDPSDHLTPAYDPFTSVPDLFASIRKDILHDVSPLPPEDINYSLNSGHVSTSRASLWIGYPNLTAALDASFATSIYNSSHSYWPQSQPSDSSPEVWFSPL